MYVVFSVVFPSALIFVEVWSAWSPRRAPFCMDGVPVCGADVRLMVQCDRARGADVLLSRTSVSKTSALAKCVVAKTLETHVVSLVCCWLLIVCSVSRW